MELNVFDIVVYLALLWALFNGWFRGFLVQLLSLAGIVAALWLAIAYGAALGELLGLEDAAAGIAGFIAVFVAAAVAAGMVARMLRSVFRFAGLGGLDSLLGVLFSAAKVLLVLSVLFAWFDTLNADYGWADRATVEESRWFRPVAGISERLTPYFDELKEKMAG